MHSVEARTHIKQRLPDRLVKELIHLAEKYRGKGIRLFIFGSFARSSDHKTSDLDLGVIWSNKRIPKTFTELYRDVQELPTIRKIDLVDMEQVEEKFKNEAMKHALFLLEEEKSL